LHGEFTLRSGAVSSIYFDKYLLESDPVLLGDIVDGMVALVPDDVEALAGLEMGGIPLVTLLSQRTGLPAYFVRKEAKAYGTCRLAEGGDVQGKRLLLVEDVVTSGGQILLSTQDLRELGATVETVVCIIDREAGAVESLARAGLQLRPLFRRAELDAALRDS
jgi:orotate phosphoribosyltransferase